MQSIGNGVPNPNWDFFVFAIPKKIGNYVAIFAIHEKSNLNNIGEVAMKIRLDCKEIPKIAKIAKIVIKNNTKIAITINFIQ